MRATISSLALCDEATLEEEAELNRKTAMSQGELPSIQLDEMALAGAKYDRLRQQILEQ